MMTVPDKSEMAGDRDSVDLITQTRVLRRKVTFWRRAAWLIFGAAAVFGVVFWNRGETRRRECRESLEHYAAKAVEEKLSQEHAELLAGQWNGFEQPTPGVSAVHYDLIVRNWAIAPKAGESFPLAICRDRHITSFSIGRHVLMSTETGYKVFWLDEEEAEPILAEALRDNRSN